MTLTVNEGFESFLTRLTPTAAERSASAKHRESVKSALEAKFTVSRFFETGSFSHGTGVRSFSDVDVFVSVSGSRPDSSYATLEKIRNALAERFQVTLVTIDRPAVKVKFALGTETWEVIPAYEATQDSYGHLIYDIPGASVGSGWIQAAPDAHLTYVNACNESPSRGTGKALARLVKAWKYYCNVPISSFYLEMRAAQHVSSVETYIHVWDICLLLEKLNTHQLASMNDPAAASGRINACSSDAKREEALSKLATAAVRSRNALDAHKADKADLAFYYLGQLFAGQFPSRA
ncbi:MAG: nucleotidyltransferase [Thermomicrobiales bacterium]